MTTRNAWKPRGEQTWPEWRRAVPGETRVEHVRSGRRGTFVRWPASNRRLAPGYAVIEWDRGPEHAGIRDMKGRVVAYAWDLREVT